MLLTHVIRVARSRRNGCVEIFLCYGVPGPRQGAPVSTAVTLTVPSEMLFVWIDLFQLTVMYIAHNT